jgi:hypothetical protein
MGMNINEAETIVDNVSKQVVEQAEVQKAFGNLTKTLYDKREGVITGPGGAADTLQKIDRVDPSYALQLAVGLKRMLEETIPTLYKEASKIMPKNLRNALRTIIAYKVELPSIMAKDAYNARAGSMKFKQEAGAKISEYKSVLGGI